MRDAITNVAMAKAPASQTVLNLAGKINALRNEQTRLQTNPKVECEDEERKPVEP